MIFMHFYHLINASHCDKIEYIKAVVEDNRICVFTAIDDYEDLMPCGSNSKARVHNLNRMKKGNEGLALSNK